MEHPPAVLLKFLGVSPAEGTAGSSDLAVLGGTITVLLGDETSAAGKLARYAAGLESPRKGKVLAGSGMAPATSREGRAATGYITDRIEAPPGMTPRGCVNLAVTASGKNRSSAGKNTGEILAWLDLETVSNLPLEELSQPEIQEPQWQSAWLPHQSFWWWTARFTTPSIPKLKTYASAGNAVLIRTSSLGEIPSGVERIALCNKNGILRVVRHSELLSRAVGGAEVSVAFYPSLPRTQIETINGVKNLLHKDGKYRFTHSETTYAVTQLMNLARANSRAVIELHISRMPPAALLKLFEQEKEKPETGGLFKEEEGF